MGQPCGIRVTLRDGVCRNFLPGPSHPGVSAFVASPDVTGHWLEVRAICPGLTGYVHCRFPNSIVLQQELLQ